MTAYIQNRLDKCNTLSNNNKRLGSKRSQARLHSLENKQQKFIERIASQIEDHAVIEERVGKWQNKPRESNTTCSGGVDTTIERYMDKTGDRMRPTKTQPVLLQQPTYESLSSNNQLAHSPKLSKPAYQKEKAVIFTHNLNNRFKMMDFFEHDESLNDARKGYRVDDR